MRWGGGLLQATIILLLQDPSPDQQQVLFRVATHNERGIQEKLPTQSKALVHGVGSQSMLLPEVPT
jgi:hypothetical protein